MMWLAAVLAISLQAQQDAEFLDALSRITVRSEVIQSTVEEANLAAGEGEQDAAPPSVSITFERMASATPRVATRQVTERWLVSEAWCRYCPAAKARFLSSGGKPENILTLAEAARRHGRRPASIPYEYTTTETITEPVAAASYRSQWPPKWDVEGDRNASRDTYLRHLRGSSQHAGKAWQSYDLESFSREQLAALHDDDHDGRVQPIAAVSGPSATIGTVSHSSATPALVAAALTLHLIEHSGQEPSEPPVVAGLFDIEVNAPQQLLDYASALLTKQRLEIPSAGITCDWSGNDRAFAIKPDRIEIRPGLRVTARKFGLTVSTTLEAIAYKQDMSEVTLELKGAPDLTLRFVTQ